MDTPRASAAAALRFSLPYSPAAWPNCQPLSISPLSRVLGLSFPLSSSTVSHFLRICLHKAIPTSTTYPSCPWDRRLENTVISIPSIDNRIVSILLYSTPSFRPGRPFETFYAGFSYPASCTQDRPAACRLLRRRPRRRRAGYSFTLWTVQLSGPLTSIAAASPMRGPLAAFTSRLSYRDALLH